jgi:hypothetical protein
MKPLSKGAIAAQCVIAWCHQHGLESPATEYRFCPERRWRFDLAFLTAKLAVEINGGGWINGRHNRGSSLEAEYEKLGHAAALGWRVIPVSYRQLSRGDLFTLLSGALRSDGQEK